MTSKKAKKSPVTEIRQLKNEIEYFISKANTLELKISSLQLENEILKKYLHRFDTATLSPFVIATVKTCEALAQVITSLNQRR